MKRFYGICVAAIISLIFIAGSVAPAGALEFGARASYWFPTVKATVRAGSSGTEVNLKDELGISDSNTYSLEAFGGIGNHHLSFSYTPLDYTGQRTITKPFNFNNFSYASGTNVSTDMRLRIFDAEYRYDLLNLENILAGFSINLIGKIEYVDGDVRLDSSASGLERKTFGLPVPMIGLGTHVGLIANLLEARAKVTGMGYSGNYIVDALADVAVTPFPFTRLFVGYRYLGININNVSDTYGALTFFGPYLGLTVAF